MKVLRYFVLLTIVIVIISSCATAEVRAVRKGDLQQLEKFLSKGGDPDTIFSDGNPLIHIAVIYGQTVSLERLLTAGADPNLFNSSGDTAAILASGQNRFDMLKILLKYKADMKIAGNGGKTTLMLASANGNIPMMERLLSVNVPINAVDNRGFSALFYSVSAKNSEALSYLLTYGADPMLTDNNGRNPLHLMTQNRYAPYARLLLEAGTDPSGMDNSTGETPLHIASGTGAWELVELYLSKGAQSEINVSSRNGGTPLFYALKQEIPSPDALKTLQILLRAGADANIPSASDVLPITYAVEKRDVLLVEELIQGGARINIRLSDSKSLLHLAVLRDMPELVSLLINKGVNLNLKDINGNTALMAAVAKDFVNVSERLLAKGADPNIVNNTGASTLLITLEKDAGLSKGFSAMTNLLLRYNAYLPNGKQILSKLILITRESGNADVLEYLLKSGADSNEISQQGMTLLMSASQQNFLKYAQVLLNYSARVNMRDNRGYTAMHYAAQAGSVEIVELLLRFGENPDPVNYEKKRPIQLVPENVRGIRITEILLEAGAEPVPLETSTEIEVTPEVENIPEVEVTPEVKATSDVDVTPEVKATSDVDVTPEVEAASDVVVTSEDITVTDVIIVETQSDNGINDENWRKARILTLGEKEPRGISNTRMNFPGYSSRPPQSYPKNLTSKSNPREVIIYILNDSPVSAEIYQVKTDSFIEPVSVLAPGEMTEITTRQGNVFTLYSHNNSYFGEIQTTGQEKQYYRLVSEE